LKSDKYTHVPIRVIVSRVTPQIVEKEHVARNALRGGNEWGKHDDNEELRSPESA
jgi:hypothetical protein